jgi:choline-sulfatase
MPDRPNVLLIMSDEHAAAATGYAGHPNVQTPALDRLAAEGFAFSNSFCSSPMCVPSRMSFLSGRYSSDVNVWDNGSPLASKIPTFATYLEASGYETTLCGRMHMIGSDRTHGFGKRLYDDKAKWQSIRQTPPRTPEWRRGTNSHVAECGPGDGSWLEYDGTVFDMSRRYLESKAGLAAGVDGTSNSKPWLLVTGLTFPHFPLICPQRYFDMYYPDNVTLSSTADEKLEDQHPWIRQMRTGFHNDAAVAESLQRRAIASYYGLISLVDEYVGNLVKVINQSHLRENTIIIYTSDHGEMGGDHGIWQKQCFYESAIRVPLVIRFPRVYVSRGARVGTPVENAVSLVDIAPTLLDLAGERIPERWPGSSLINVIAEESENDRAIFSQYHAQGSTNGGYMLKRCDLKLNYYTGSEPELFDLSVDPNELNNVAADASRKPDVEGLTAELRRILDPEATDSQAKADQQKRMKIKLAQNV